MPKPLFMSNAAASLAVLQLEVALYRACKDRHGSMSAIAEMHGFSRDHFINQLDPNKPNCHVSPEAIEAIVAYTKDPRILDSVCVAHGNAAWFELPDLAALDQCDFYQIMGKCGIELGEMSKTICDAISDGRISSIENAMIKKECMDVIRVAAQIMAMADAKAGE